MAEESHAPQARIERRDTRSYHVQGAMTFDSVTDLWHQSEGIFEDDGVLRIDLADVTRTDSGGLALLIEWLREAKRRGRRVEFLNLPNQMRALASAANLGEILGVKEDTSPT
jgi:phospholipid transport system transporter-binding protein